MTNPTDTNHDRTILPSEAFGEGYVPEFNQASEDELDTFMKQLGFFWDSYQSDWRNNGRKQFSRDYDDSISMDLAKQLLAHLRTEKLKLLDEVVHQSTVNLKSAKAVAGWAELRKEQLEAEL